MMGFVIAGGLMVVTAMVFVLPPLVRRRAPGHATSMRDANLLVYRNQLRELEADLASGTLSADQFEASRQELQRRLLEDVGAVSQASPVSARGSPKTAIAVATLVPLAAALLYWHLGTPSAVVDGAAQPASSPHGEGHGSSFEQIDVLAQRLAERLAQQPDDAEGWAMLARSYNVLGRHAQAADAYGKAARLVPDDAQLLADYADALAMSQGGRLEGNPLKLVQRALKADPRNVKALALAGTAAFDQRDYRGAAAYWQRGLDAAGPGSEFAESLNANLAEARALAAGKPVAAPATLLPQGGTTTAAAPSRAPARIAGRITLAPELLARTSPDDAVFVFARAAQGPRMPLALLRRQVKDLPLEFVLDDATAMTPAFKLSDFERVVVVARVSKAGTAEARSGDLEGTSGPISALQTAVRVRIDQALH